MKYISKKDIEDIKERYLKKASLIHKHIVICAGTGCIANGSLLVYQAMIEALEVTGLSKVVDLTLDIHEDDNSVYLSRSGCQGFCAQGPLVTIFPDEIMYVKVKPEDALEIIQKTLVKKELIDRLLYINPSNEEISKGPSEIPFYNQQNRLVLGECGKVDPESIEEYISHGGYIAAEKAFNQLTDKEICDMILQSGLRGRGGGGFSTGQKWELTRLAQSDKKYVICNGDEGDPGAFMDRSLMEGNPHRIVEGIMIAAKAINADEAYVYVRAEYPLAVKRMKKAIEDAHKMGILGSHVFGSKQHINIHVMEGAGAFVCGEETALIGSIEGHRGMPNRKPPYPSQKGLFGKSTVINNVETLATVPLIIKNGPEWINSIGTEKSKGTKIFALTGHVANTGLIEVPFGTTLREIIYNVGGGIVDKTVSGETIKFKAVQMGGPSGGCIPEHLLDTIVDYDSVIATGAIMGSGGLVVMDENTCMVDMARFFLDFTQKESCGKCTFCRIGSKRMLEILLRITQGEGKQGDIELLEELSEQITKSSLCGLGQTAPNPVLTTLKYFKHEYEAHIRDKKCPAKKCKPLITYEINSGKCTGCTACKKACPVSAISGERKLPHLIDQSLCTKCGMCYSKCKFQAITIG
ncbi:MAG TPA: NADH-ubiquinone oxidoreductase-F iron-sulfur binding region domain-containing protein [Bacteroidales bacterium]|nr:NADH-ubiquinone oxidoreductase-F iron-sulfur binding region domain-containing protein [Bacteroidales bacterium]HPS16455.1 NADH-ubiquinone oxidoreductase-F iron-sulfur binding region domain-containing protein [Bacteroidales bacterium]HQH18095.1 NADH-ubiquinone oxidoreductase-F iron-sulfur binding region domain-containing protein [Bacteroidales bacterium]HQI44598.1 NADH-ubiquinone oxidoreductase-F iron-sulfur binding region domain-containing protein [Bacteroidales bacterium]